jgi:hypothetical protein
MAMQGKAVNQATHAMANILSNFVGIPINEEGRMMSLIRLA